MHSEREPVGHNVMAFIPSPKKCCSEHSCAPPCGCWGEQDCAEITGLLYTALTIFENQTCGDKEVFVLLKGYILCILKYTKMQIKNTE